MRATFVCSLVGRLPEDSEPLPTRQGAVSLAEWITWGSPVNATCLDNTSVNMSRCVIPDDVGVY